MVTIFSDYENDYVRELTATTGDKAWIGLSDRFSEDTWDWVDGTQSNFKQWNEGESTTFYKI